jgi:glucan 1,3-beta-glucosidase
MEIGIGIGVALVLLIIIIAVAVSASKKHKSSSTSAASSTSSGTPSNSNLDGMSENDIPVAARGTYLDPFTWYDTSDFNVTYTNETVGDLPIMGLNTSYNDDVAPNSNAPKISAKWGAYTSRPARGVNLGGWLSIEPFITPSLFNSYSSADGIIDEWTLTTKLGATAAASTLEKHYATFVTEQTFADIAAAGLDHVRIPFSYWAVITYDDDPYVFRTSWRYLLRGIEWARKHGLRINLDLHALPGSQNGWNHSGRQGTIGWLNGTNGNLNAQRSIEIHDRLSKFFAQDRYKNIISFYGLANEPRMTSLNVTAVLDWTSTVTDLVTKNGISAYVVIGDGFRGLENWQGDLTSYSNLVLDVHQYVIFNSEQIVYNHTAKVTYACSGWTQQTKISMDKSTGFGPTMVAEWSQADTDCATYLTNVNQGNRWEGTYNTGDSSTAQTTPDCPTQNSQCSCDSANADPSTYSDTYKEFLQMFAEAQMHSFELGWGWFYWTWKTETSKGGGTQWSKFCSRFFTFLLACGGIERG